jgi:phosphonate ABC transporter permease subunit PhnE
MLTTHLSLSLGGLVVLPLIGWGTARWALPQEEELRPNTVTRLGRMIALLVAALAFVLSLFLISNLAIRIGESLNAYLGPFGFLGTFIGDLAAILGGLIGLITGLAGGATLSNLVGRLWQVLKPRLSITITSATNYLFAAVAGAALFALVGMVIDGLYQIDDPIKTLYIPAGAGMAFGLVLAYMVREDDEVPFGLVVYYIARTIFNTLRSIEPLIMVIVFAVWVGIGPFAGVLALALHTIAALAKLYSEQVESILPGPLEAIKAAGATRMQTIVYAVIPQIVPPYIAFTMYRWDINVRMSTIIGFAGGGGIGFLLQQNINLLNYRAASAQMFAIAIVVASMDYISSRLRERVV